MLTTSTNFSIYTLVDHVVSMMHRFRYILGLNSKCSKGLDAQIGEKIEDGEVRNEVGVEVKMTKEAISYK